MNFIFSRDKISLKTLLSWIVSNKVRFFCGFITTSLILFIFLINNERMHTARDGVIYSDSWSYELYADAIRTGSVFNRDSKSSIALSTRTPVFPIIILLSKFLFGDSDNSLLVMHSALLFTVTTVIFLLFSEISIVSITAALIAASLSFRFYFFAMLTEWTAFLILLVWLGTIYRALKGDENSFYLGLLVSIATLTRPALLIIMPLTLVSLWGHYCKALPRFVLGLLPLILYMLINVYRLGSFAISPYGGYQLFLSASLMGQSRIDEGDPELYKQFAASLNSKLYFRQNLSRNICEQIHGADFIEDGIFKIDYNLWNIAEPLRRSLNLSVPTANSFLQQYSVRVLRSNITKYIDYISCQIELCKDAIIFNLLQFFGLATIYYVVRLDKRRYLFKLAMLSLVLHLMHIVLITALAFVTSRYYELSNSIFNFTFVLIVMDCIVQISKKLFSRFAEPH